MNRFQLISAKIAFQFFQFALVLVGITFLTFTILYLSPRDPAELWLAGSDGNAGIISEEAVAEQAKIMGLDKPFIIQYGSWLAGVFQGDLGVSFTTRRPVTTELLDHMAPTMIMTFVSLLLTVLLSVPLGICCAVYKDKLVDNAMRVFSFFGISLPSFVLSLLLLWLVCVRLKLLPVIAEEGMRGLILPIAVLVVQCASKMIRQVRGIVLEQMDQPYVEGALVRGVPRCSILFSHILKNSAAPILTCISIYTGVFMGGAAVIEGIFSVNGLGRLAVSSAARLDYNMLLGFVLWCALIYLLVNLLVDILSALIDPRIQYDRV